MPYLRVPLTNPKPDIEAFCKVIRRQMIPKRPPLVEFAISDEANPELRGNFYKLNATYKEGSREFKEIWAKLSIELWLSFGYDYIHLGGGQLKFERKSRITGDTASKGNDERSWTEEGKGPISSWEDFEKYPWPSVRDVDLYAYEVASKNLPDGMGMFARPTFGFFELPMDVLMGYETLSYAIYDQPDLIEAVFNKAGELIYEFYRKLAGLDKLTGFFQGDDMGFKTATLVPPDFLRKHVLPWHKKTAKLAHDNGLLYLLHSCGQLEAIMDDLIDDVEIDAKHSYEDAITPVTEFKKKYGKRITILGGVDMDILCRAPEDKLRAYLRNILDVCSQGGGYAFGSGNSIANYVPVKNYKLMIEEGLNYRK
ncbi:MAG: hypothetical protein A2297_05495 [Elusimicrobia bacterium RIFOXYB2_FULL_48_7]|nr:MAG: hypothetical protein A2297_05495 [Elusimicrobia bacterium RIFOXYB2_FULL_48_7]